MSSIIQPISLKTDSHLIIPTIPVKNNIKVNQLDDKVQ